MELREITDFNAPELDVYARLTENQLVNRADPAHGLFIAESPLVIGRALDAGCEPVSFLMERRHVEGKARELLENETERRIAAILPCGIAFWRGSDGMVYASKLNMPLLGRLLGGTPAFVFPRRIEPDQREILRKIAKNLQNADDFLTGQVEKIK